MKVRTGDWISTLTGPFWPLDIRDGDFNIIAIAHGLAHECRFGGHCAPFYTVAQHAVLCSRMAPDKYKFEALMHDDVEAYLRDIPKPIKTMLPDYQALEQRIWEPLAATFGLPLTHSRVVKEIDCRMMSSEAEAFMPDTCGEWWLSKRYEPPYQDGTLDLRPWGPDEAREQFLHAYALHSGHVDLAEPLIAETRAILASRRRPNPAHQGGR